MGRKLTLPFFVATLTSTWYGGILSVTQISYQYGLYNFITQGFVWYCAYLLFAVLYGRKLYQNNYIALPDFAKQIYGHKSAKLTALLLLFKSLPIAYAIGIGSFIAVLFNIDL
jgi:SSS family solute:Na+ symporter